ncbi:SRS domain-containing protein [Neospora caninum Liverpool]|uniref:SRS domain-containing protein n=1 Tax=Neospora caninum (strain Liverpool) TaxID=572307 RepID=F0VRC7_NEOCL|nr:SRS domain-containing protein [Neospora caninum Liverpool]CBZ56275.1 SRS domain-containing protein [Neospora caninum Liverpool]CEL71038.1 TPA: SRS domain-containing protein [Neospora caninum Liverpool]|eukprot:XP_003886300.1 SRS domain-containing protein [Neospora caninum Liverpool]
MKGQRALTAISFLYLGFASAKSVSATSVLHPGRVTSGEQAGGSQRLLSPKHAVSSKVGNECSSNAGIEIDLEPDQTEAVFKCGGSHTTLDPDQLEAEEVYLTDECDVPTDLQEAVPGATWDDSEKESNTYKLIFPEHRMEDYKVYYQCTPASDAFVRAPGLEVEGIRGQKRKSEIQQISGVGEACKVTITAKKEPLAEDPGLEKTCSKPYGAVVITLGSQDTDAVFKCGEQLTTLEPAQDSTPKFCKSSGCEETEELETISEAYWDERKKDQHIYRVVFPAEGRQSSRLWYKCKNQSPGKSWGGVRSGHIKKARSDMNEEPSGACTVLIDVQSSTGDDVHDEELEECTPGTENQVTLSPDQPVNFWCARGTALVPPFSRENQKVYDDSDGSCSVPASLTSLVDAVLQEEQTPGFNTKYTMELTAVPTSTKKLCLQCYQSEGKTCKVRIEVPGAAAVETTTSTPPASGAGSLSGLVSCVIGFLCVGFLFSP